MKNGKRIAIGARPTVNPQADAWVRQGDGADIGRADLYTARLTIDVTPALRARIKVTAFTQGITVAEMLRVLLEREFPDQRP
jgi:type II secretory pathway component PulJ